MYTEEKIRRVNKIIRDMIFECKGEVNIGLTVNVEYQFRITGVKKMISVGDWYDFLVVDVTIVGGDERFNILCKIMPELVTKDYRLLVNTSNLLSPSTIVTSTTRKSYHSPTEIIFLTPVI